MQVVVFFEPTIRNLPFVLQSYFALDSELKALLRAVVNECVRPLRRL